MTAIIRGLVVMSIAFGAVYRVFDSLSIAPTCIVMTPMPAIGNWNALQRDILAWLCEWIAVCLYVCVRCIHLRNWDALHALIARRYGPYYGFQSPEIG